MFFLSNYNTFDMVALHFLFLFTVVSCIIAWPFGDKVNVNFETKYDTNHNELKQLLSDHKAFKPNNWTNYALLIQLIVGTLVLVIILIYAYRRCWPILKLVCRSQQHHQNYLNNLPPYAYTPNLFSTQLFPQNNSFAFSP